MFIFALRNSNKKREQMKRFALIIAAILLTFSGIAQRAPKFTEEDAKQFYRTLEGDYSLFDEKDSLLATVHFTPIWESVGNRFQWLYVEASKGKEVVLQKVLEINPKNDKVFHVVMHDLNDPEQFAGKWGNRNFFDGFTTSILKRGPRIAFVKTSDFSYQTNGFLKIPTLSQCFSQGDLLHFKFVQEDERFYIKRIPVNTNNIRGYQGRKELTD